MRTWARILRPSSPSPWKLYGEVRGLVGAAAEKFDARFFYAFGGAQALLFGFYGAGAADEADVSAAEEDVAAGSGDAED